MYVIFYRIELQLKLDIKKIRYELTLMKGKLTFVILELCPQVIRSVLRHRC